jgi:hypothetical protein
MIGVCLHSIFPDRIETLKERRMANKFQSIKKESFMVFSAVKIICNKKIKIKQGEEQ